MNRSLVDRIADAVLYEGYLLYPYRPSIKNRQRWTFGGLFPEPYRRVRGGDASANRTECLVRGTRATAFDARVRFLHLTARLVGAIDPPLADWPAGPEPPSRPVESLRVGGELIHAWQEAEEREVALEGQTLGDLLAGPIERAFAFPGGRRSEPLRGFDGEVVGVLSREQEWVEGGILVEAAEVAEGLYRVSLCVECRTPVATPKP